MNADLLQVEDVTERPNIFSPHDILFYVKYVLYLNHLNN